MLTAIAAFGQEQTINSRVLNLPMLPKRKKSLLAAQLGRFVQEYGRKATKGWDPNDRGYDRKLEEKIKRMSPEDLSDLLSSEDVEPVHPHSKPAKKTDN